MNPRGGAAERSAGSFTSSGLRSPSANCTFVCSASARICASSSARCRSFGSSPRPTEMNRNIATSATPTEPASEADAARVRKPKGGTELIPSSNRESWFLLRSGLGSGGVILLQPFDPVSDVVVQIPPPAVASLIGHQLDHCPIFLQILLSLLGHPKRTDAVVRRMVEEVGMPFGLLQWRKKVRLENRHCNKGAGDL